MRASRGAVMRQVARFGAWNRATIGEDLKPFRRAADAIEASGFQYIILRPAWLMDEDEVDYELTSKVSRSRARGDLPLRSTE